MKADIKYECSECAGPLFLLPLSPSSLSFFRLLAQRHHCANAPYPRGIQCIYGGEISHQGASNSHNFFLRVKWGSFIGKSLAGTVQDFLTPSLLLSQPLSRFLFSGIKQQPSEAVK